jgi:uncharacterized phage-like protein YoqJ
MILGFTGHRQLQHSERVLGYKLIEWLKQWKPEQAISGVAVGFDQLAARVCIYLGIPLIAAVPAKNQSEWWPSHIQKVYYKILDRASKVVYVDEVPRYNVRKDFKAKLLARNRWIVDNSDRILAYCLDNVGEGGTYHTICYARKRMKLVITTPFSGLS